jgi:DNA-binding HxlR family transcriptional regulator
MQKAEADTKTLERSRSGGRVLALLAVPLNGLILRALGKRPMRLSDLRAELGGPAQTTLRGHLRKLAEVGALANANGGAPSAAENELSDAGLELLDVTEVLATWLRQAPYGPISLGSVGAKGTIKALAGGWESTMLRAFATQALSLTQLDSLISSLSYPALERRLSAMRATGLVEPAPSTGDRTPYVITPWARKAAGPVSAAARFERTHLREHTAPLKSLDVEAAFLLSTPMVALSSRTDGTCQLAAHTGGNSQKLAGVRVVVDRGTIVECVSQLEPKPRNWAVGSASAWLDAVVHHDVGRLRIGGDEVLAQRLIQGVHETLFSANGNGKGLVTNGNGHGRNGNGNGHASAAARTRS